MSFQDKPVIDDSENVLTHPIIALPLSAFTLMLLKRP